MAIIDQVNINVRVPIRVSLRWYHILLSPFMFIRFILVLLVEVLERLDDYVSRRIYTEDELRNGPNRSYGLDLKYLGQIIIFIVVILFMCWLLGKPTHKILIN